MEIQQHQTDYRDILDVLHQYYDGLYHCDTRQLAKVFHANAMYVTASGDNLLMMDMAQYFPVINNRISPQSKQERYDYSVDAIDLAGPQTASARLRCEFLGRRFVDLLTLIKSEGRWQVISKVFHFDELPSSHINTTK